MSASLSQLNEKFGVPGKAEILEGRGGLPCVRVTSANATGEVYLHGGHVTSWSPNCGRDLLFMSMQSEFREGKAIRGGIPICFPWFGPKRDDKNAPSHGFVRTRPWMLQNIDASGPDVIVNMSCESSPDTKRLWDYNFRIDHQVRFGADLQCDLKVTNTGSTPFSFEAAQHTYFRVGDIRQARVSGLEGTKYLDKVADGREALQQGEILFESETDRIYLNTTNSVTLVDSLSRQKCVIEKNGSRNTVVWNPWIAKAHALSDLGDEEYKFMVCIETACVGQGAIGLEPSAEHTMTSLFRVLS